jgi:hypothetical protein
MRSGGGQAKRGPGRPPMNGVRALTEAEKKARWRAKHARRLARKQQYVARPMTMGELQDLMIVDFNEIGF